MLYLGYIVWQTFIGLSGLGAILWWIIAHLYGWQRALLVASAILAGERFFRHTTWNEIAVQGFEIALALAGLLTYSHLAAPASPFKAENMVFLFVLIWTWGIVEVFVKAALRRGNFRDLVDVEGKESLWLSSGRFLLLLSGFKLLTQGAIGEVIFLALLYLCEKGIGAQKHVSEGYKKVLETLVRMLEAKDETTRGHSERVAYYAGEIAHEMGLPLAKVATVVQAGWFHDLGKLVVRDEILNKPGGLTAEEWAEIKLHPTHSGEFLESLGVEKEIIEGVTHHHERLDGKGYPDGISELSLISRIIAVADAFDAMTSSRPYRPAMSFGEAIGEMKKSAGKQHDPTVILAFERFLESKKEIDPKSELGKVTPRTVWEPGRRVI